MNRAEDFRGLIEGLFRTDFNRFFGLWGEEHLRLMLVLRQYCGNDLDKIIIMASIGQQQLRDPALPPRDYAPTTDSQLLGNKARYTNVDGLASATGIPRESVRRKVNELIEAGWVERVGTRGLAMRPQSAVDMQPATLTVFAVLDRLFAEFAIGLIERGELRIERPGPGSAPADARKRKPVA